MGTTVATNVWRPEDFTVFSQHVDEAHGDHRFHENCDTCNQLAFAGWGNATPRRSA